MTEWTGLISYLLYGLFSAIRKMNTIKNTASNFQHPHIRGHSRSCSLKRNKSGDAIALMRDDVKKFLGNIKARLGGDLSWEIERKVQTCL